MKLERGSRLGRFVIRERIGAGGMGTVYRAFDTVLLRQVAIKTMQTEKLTHGDALLRFRREALSVSQLDDPHIVKLIDLFEGDRARNEPPYIVMELLRGQDLQQLLKSGLLEVSRVVDIMLQVCSAVSTCHLQGFVHRDLKATNIFLTEYNGIETAKVLDFGVAKLRREASSVCGKAQTDITRDGMVFGTPEYLAPEIFRGIVAGPSTDQYALGILLYTALAGGPRPFELDREQENAELKLWRAVIAGAHLPVRAHRWEVPPGLEELIERALKSEPRERFSSVHALGEALLPWASVRARLQWAAHFTNVPKVPPFQTTTLGIEYGSRFGGQASLTGPTVPAGLRLHDERSPGIAEAVTVACLGGTADSRWSAGYGIPEERIEGSDGYVQLATHDLVDLASASKTAIVERDRTATVATSVPRGSPSSPIASRARQSSRYILRILLAAVVLAGVSTTPSLVRRSRHRPIEKVSPPAEILSGIKNAQPLNPTHQTASPVPPMASTVSAGVVTFRPVASVVKKPVPSRAPVRPIRAKQPKREFDENGIGIPSD